MDFTLTDEQLAMQRAGTEFADKWLRPHAARMDEERNLDPKVLQEAGRLGFYGMNVPKEHGGLGLDSTSMGLVAGAFGRACGSTALSMFAHTVLACEHIRRRGSPEQHARWLPKLASGEWVGAWGLTEPRGGSDVPGMATRAEPDGDDWVLNGEKCFITNGSKGRLAVVTARTPGGYGAFVVEHGATGFTASRSHDVACMRASDTASLTFADVRVPADQVLGDPTKAMADSYACLGLERVVAGGLLMGMAREMMERSIAYAKQREAFGRPVSSYQSIQRRLARLDADIECCDNVWLKAAWLRDRGDPFMREAAIAKLNGAELAQRAAHDAIQIHAGAGLEVASGLERMLRDTLIGAIGGGTTEMMEYLIAKELGLGGATP